jgi:predicted transcriptional regulator
MTDSRQQDGDGGGVADPFERCPDCERVAVDLARHRCPSDSTHGEPANSAERADRAAADGRNPDREVLAPGTQAARAYHELDDGAVRCWLADADGGMVVEQREAARRGYYPCAACWRADD